MSDKGDIDYGQMRGDLMGKLANQGGLRKSFKSTSEYQRENKQLKELAKTDPLTGLPNRRQFDSDMQKVVARFKRGGYQFSVLSIDLREFKNINDTLGHPEGDRALVFFSNSLKRGVRQGMDSVYRIGGDEFMIILEGTNSVRGEVVQDHLETFLAKDKSNYPQDKTIQMINMNKSLKVWTETDNVDAFMQELDKKMYEEKRGQSSK